MRRDLKAAQRGVSRVRLYDEPRFPFVRLMTACDQAGFMNVHGVALAEYERARDTSPTDLEWYLRGLVHSASSHLEGEVARWSTLMRLLAGDARPLPVLPT